MQKLSLIAGLVLLIFSVTAQENPHGGSLKIACIDCHTTEGWTFSKETAKFSHDKTTFALEGQHAFTDCASCHTSLVFNEAKTSCVDCHADMHNNTVGPNCSQCHTPKSWIVENITEIHQMSRFPLLGSHNTASCSDCHTSASKLEFQPLGIDCYDCHRADYQATTNPNHAQIGLSTNCIECHRIDAFAWEGAGINHDFFPLTKGHEINECASCHTAGLFEPISPDCYSCHQTDYNATLNPSHQNLGFSTTCTECHTTDPGWNPAEFKSHDALLFPIYSGSHRGEWESCTDCHTQAGNYNLFSCTDCHEHNKSDMDKEHREENGYSYNSLACYACHPSGRGEGAFNHNATGFPLKGAHIQTTCLDCHTTGYAGTSASCSSCHTKNYNSAANPSHVTAGISTECETCHTEDGWSPSLFDHSVTTGFELTGGHSGKQCSACHIGNTTSASPDCFSCHQSNYNSAENHLAQNYPHECLQCHTTNSWESADFDHNTTAFPLKGAHAATECASCHTNGYAGTSTLCASCHTDNYNNAQNPGHTAAGISTECETCHNSTAWIPSEFNHTTTTGFELTGGHSGKQCSACHIGNTTSASSDCFSCHQSNYNSAENHLAQNYPHDCLQCHTTNSWDGADFDHNATAFPLKGAHTATECVACHTNGYAGTSTLCASCHTDNYNNAQNPGHTAAGISTECETCHNSTAWIPSEFNHTTTTGFELTGGHSGKQCSACHIGNTTSASSDCFSCHQSNYNSAENHLAQNYPHDCLQCHTTNSWDGADFDHNATAFPLKGAHVATECAACHTNGYTGTSTLCASCHTANYNATQNPVHSTAGISTECETCHNSTAWIPSEFDHTTTTGFALTGGHSGKQCSACHIGNTTSASSDCFSCHQSNYNSAENHLAQNYPHDCLQCHSTNSWDASNFDHNVTAFPLTGSHTATECSACHTNGYAGTSTLCSSCHTDNYNNTTNPNHSSLGISTNCDDCHNTGPGWEPALFPTHNQYYALNGAHATIASSCYLCHAGNYTNTANTCSGCHSSDFNNNPNPTHTSVSFASDCAACHTENAWQPATFDHDNQYFPIYSGKHQGEWNSCTDCHTQPSNYSVFSCIDCHEHNKTDMDSEHRGENGYVYASANCLACHPDGRNND